MKNLLTLILFLSFGFQYDNSDQKAANNNHSMSGNDNNSCIQGFVIQNHSLKVRIVDNSKRYYSMFDNFMEGMNGVAVLINSDQRKNIFSTTGMNLESTHTDPPFGKFKDVWNAPRVAPMHIDQIDSLTVKLTQSAAEASGLNFEIAYSLGKYYIDQSITFWPDIDLKSSTAFFASYMNLVQNTSLYLRRPQNSEKPGEWLEVVSAGHGGGGEIYARALDPLGLKWYEFNMDNPLLRQAIQQTPETKAATLKSGYSLYNDRIPDHFWFGFVDEYILIMIFKEPVFNMWISASGSMAVRCPAWDYSFSSGPQKAYEKRTYHVRAVYKKYESINDILTEVNDYLKTN
jgi:hypothetical protein